MTFASGTRFGSYEITSLIGVGGMGEVYRATDLKLGRTVAVKTLPSELANDRDRLARFEREAKLLAALNHPHIASIFGLYEHEGTQFLAMELVEGETLERELHRTPMPIDDALRLALQIAEALEAAHEKGVVHRDLKPANVMVTRSGQIKVLDFGLAKAISSDPNRTTVGQSPALSLAMTQAGLLLGTAGYMSPEQASGQSIDQRADIWAFGVVLYEMLTGAPLFSGESVPHVLADVLKSEPDWSRLPKNLHPRIKQLLERCLTKNPRNRLHSIADARVEIEAVLADPNGITRDAEAAVTVPRGSRAMRLGAVGVAAALAGAVAGGLLRPVPAPTASPVARFTIPLPADQTFTADQLSAIAISPDGARIAYSANLQLFVRELGEREARAIPGVLDPNTFSAVTPAFSPDGRWVAYIQVAGPGGPWLLRRVPIGGGAPVTIHRGEALGDLQAGLTWPTDDTILFANQDGIVSIPSNGGATRVLIPRAADERFLSPQLLPGGKAVLFTRALGTPGSLRGAPVLQASIGTAQLVVQSIGESDQTVVWSGGSAARYIPSGHLVYAQGAALFALAFDPATRVVRGGTVPILEGLRRSSTGFSDAANYAVSDNGTLVTIPADAATQGRIMTTLTWVERDGRETALPIRPDDYTMARISPDGTKIALVVGSQIARGTSPAIWLYDQRTENLSLLSGHPDGDDAPLWSTDGRRVFFRSRRAEANGVYAIDIETREVTLIGSSPEFRAALPWTITRDDRVLGLVTAASLTDFNIATLNVADGTFANLLQERATESEPSFSLNGAWIAYGGRSEDPTSQIAIRPFPGVSRTLIPVGRGFSALFSRDGTELFFVDGTALSVVPVSYEPTVRVGTPRTLFDAMSYILSVDGRSWDADPSGQRFLMIRAPATDAETTRESQRIDVVLNWFEELKTRVPTQ